MSPPIYTPDGSEVSEIVLPDGSTASEVIGPDGNVVFEAGPDIPDDSIAWYDPSQESYSDGESISLANDFVSNKDLDQGNATYQTNVQNGEPVFRFDGVDDILYTTNFPSTSPPLTIVGVCVDADQGGSNEHLFGNGPNDTFIGLYWNGSEWLLNSADTSTIGRSGSPPFVFSAVIDGSDSAIRINQNETTGDLSGWPSIDEFAIGNYGGNDRGLVGDLGEVIPVNANLQASGELASEEQRMADKYGITL